jgi:hypothetical protein
MTAKTPSQKGSKFLILRERMYDTISGIKVYKHLKAPKMLRYASFQSQCAPNGIVIHKDVVLMLLCYGLVYKWRLRL